MRLSTLLPILLCTACALVQLRVAAPDLAPAVRRAVAYLEAEYDPTIRLIRESPETAPDRYWLATDNTLASYALSTVEHELVETLRASIAAYVSIEHGLIEALAGEDIPWPPRVAEQVQVEGKVWRETRTGEGVHEDWQVYADLVLYGALDAHNEGNDQLAHNRYREALTMFDGIGFADIAFQVDKRYATYKLALAIFVGVQIGEPPDGRLLDALLAKQDPSGGFVAMYDAAGQPVGDTNTETTAYALLALIALR